MIHHSCKENEQMHEKCKNRRTNNAPINFGEETDIYGRERELMPHLVQIEN